MKQLKFRAYNRLTGRMHYDSSMACELSIYLDGSLGVSDSYYSGCEDDFVITQFTGLKYENQDVYDGDIFKWCCGDYSIVMWDSDRLMWGLSINTNLEDLHMGWELVARHGRMWSGIKGLVGNIYQNPGLIE